MRKSINRRDFIKTSTAISMVSLSGMGWYGCNSGVTSYLQTPAAYDIFVRYKPVQQLYCFETLRLNEYLPDATAKTIWMLRSVLAVFQGLINRIEPRIYLKHSLAAVDWPAIYQKEGYSFEIENTSDLQLLINQFSSSLTGYIIFDPDMLHTLNVAQTWASLENWLVILPEQEPMVQKIGLKKMQDLRGRWQHRVQAYEWAFENLFPRCSKHIVGDCCIDFPYHPASDSDNIRDFLVANRAFTFDLSASLRQRQEYRLLDKIYSHLEFPAGVWGWHDARDHEHYAVDRAARKGVYTICAAGGPNLTVHGAMIPEKALPPKQKPSPRKNLVAEKEKIYIAFMMTDGDALWVMDQLQLHNWAAARRGDFPLSWGFLPLLADIAPAMYLYYTRTMTANDYMVAGPSGAGYTYPHMLPEPEKFLQYSKFYLQKCGLEIVHITNWNDYTNWQEVDLPWFNPILFREMNNCIGYVRGMGESAFEPHYNFRDRPFMFCGEGIHLNDTDDLATIKNFIDANPNRPLFVFCLINVAVTMARIKRIVDDLQDYPVDYVRLDDFIYLVKSAYQQNLTSETLYPERKGNEQILINEAPLNWQGTRRNIERLVPIINAPDEVTALELMNTEAAGLALGQKITDIDKTDILAFVLCENMFSLVKNVLNRNGIYVNVKTESITRFMEMYGDWDGTRSIPQLLEIWQNWDQLTLEWQQIIQTGRAFLKVCYHANELFLM